MRTQHKNRKRPMRYRNKCTKTIRMSNHHGEIIQGTIEGKPFSAFIDGVPDKCHHVWNGDTIFFTKSGKMITPHTYPKWAGYTAQLREMLVHDHHNETDDPILEAATSCSKCKKVFQPDLH